MIKRVRMGQPGPGSKIPSVAIILCPKCLDPQYITKTRMAVQGGALVGVWGILSPDKVKGIKHRCHNCDYHIFENEYTRTDSIISNTVTSPSKYVATYIEPDNLWSYLAGIMLLEYSIDPWDENWLLWARRSR